MGRNGAISLTSNDGIVSAAAHDETRMIENVRYHEKIYNVHCTYTLPNRRTPVDIILQSWSIAGASGSGKYPFFNENKIRLELIKIITITVSFSAFSPCISYRNGVKFFDNIKCSTQHYYKSVVIAQAKDPK